MPVAGDFIDFQNRDGVRPHQSIQPLAQPLRREGPFDVDVSGHRHCMNSGIGSACSADYGMFASHPTERLLERLLDRRTMVLPLPAHERPAVIFDRQPPAGHVRIVPLSIGNPLSSSSTVIGARPARWTRIGLM